MRPGTGLTGPDGFTGPGFRVCGRAYVRVHIQVRWVASKRKRTFNVRPLGAWSGQFYRDLSASDERGEAVVRRFEIGGTMSHGTGWEPPDTRARRPADPILYGAFPPPPPGFAPVTGFVPGTRQPRPPIPGSVRGAVRLMWVAAILTAFQVIAACSAATEGTGFGRYYFISGGAFAESDGDRTMEFSIAFLMLAGLVFCGLWVWMLIMCRLGRHWARILSSVFFGFNALSAISLFSGGVPGMDRFLGAVITLVGLMVVILLWSSEATAYFLPPFISSGWGQPGWYPGYPGQPGAPGQPGGSWPGAGNSYRR
jgi:hypothetical protein